ncbi:hypothetical protein PISMIDRAFT_163388 [Pisolithus microcarpus 441]|uniref:Unplaced genomic scaffold scaffold_11, whole genome shotgun sequence n=1 Tax=Pisolithus microcarpus 441 TaxID=765257 RepID=A0A0C9ZNQ4_9AGAM|nr:hypothetical protein PISMIDRAFT_163388 [Pisolithus microcarpus 441]
MLACDMPTIHYAMPVLSQSLPDTFYVPFTAFLCSQASGEETLPWARVLAWCWLTCLSRTCYLLGSPSQATYCTPGHDTTLLCRGHTHCSWETHGGHLGDFFN